MKRCIVYIVAIVFIGALLIVSGCANNVERGKAQVWADTCGRCHNIRSASFYSNAQWDVAMLHMRVRANLTAKEYKDILEYLKASNN